MATINISHDTISKDLTVNIDGKMVSDVIGIEIYPSYSGDEDDFVIGITTRATDDETGITTTQRLSASESKQAKACKTAVPITDLPGFVIVDNRKVSRLADHICDFFKV